MTYKPFFFIFPHANLFKIIGTYGLLLFISGCNNTVPVANFPWTINEQCIIVNQASDNTQEGEYIKVLEVTNEKVITSSIPSEILNNANNWFIGWGNGIDYYDAGTENLRYIEKISGDTVFLGALLRGTGIPETSQNIIFISNMDRYGMPQGIEPVNEELKGGESKSFGFGKIFQYKSLWYMNIFECDTDTPKNWLVQSDDLNNWTAVNFGLPITNYELGLPEEAFPVITDINISREKVVFVYHLKDSSGKNKIGITVKNELLNSESVICSEILPNEDFDANGCYFPKLIRTKEYFVLFYDGVNHDSTENVCRAISYDLVTWKKDNQPVINSHSGWRSATYSSEPIYAEISGDSIFLTVCGAKSFNQSFASRFLSKQYVGIPGNTDDIQAGLFLSLDEGNSFIAHQNNPVYINDYSDPNENEHLGACFQPVKTDSVLYIFYSAKNDTDYRYNIFFRKKTL